MGLMGLSFLCFDQGFGAIGFFVLGVFVGFHLLLCYICVLFVGFVFEMIPWDLNELLYKIHSECAKYWNVT